MKRLIVLLFAGLAAAGCGSPVQAGSAAIIGGDRITEAEVDAKAQERDRAMAKLPARLRTQFEQGLEQQGQTVPRAVLSAMVEPALFRHVADQFGLTASDSEVAAARRSVERRAAQQGQKVEVVALAQGFAPSQLDDAFRTQVLQQKILEAVGGEPKTPQDEQRIARELQPKLASFKVKVNPRYGAWVPQALKVMGEGQVNEQGAQSPVKSRFVTPTSSGSEDQGIPGLPPGQPGQPGQGQPGQGQPGQPGRPPAGE